MAFDPNDLNVPTTIVAVCAVLCVLCVIAGNFGYSWAYWGLVPFGGCGMLAWLSMSGPNY